MGGKRKKSNNGPVKKESKYKIPARFDCPLCDTKASIVVKIFRAVSEATVRCRVCGAGGTKRWNVLRLEKPVDVFFRFHEALIQQDHSDLQQVELGREARRNSTGAGGARPEATLFPDTPAAAAVDLPRSAAAAAAPASSLSASPAIGGTRHVASLGELQRKLAMPVGVSGGAMASRAIELGDDFDGEAEGAAAHHFAPRKEVHSGEDDDKEYDDLFQ